MKMIHRDLEMEKICRSCMCESPQMRNVFEIKTAQEGNSLQLADMIMACTSIQIKSDDGLPANLCQACETKLDTAFEFKQQCEKTDSTLRQISNKIISKSSVKLEMLDGAVQPNVNTTKIVENNDVHCDSDSSDPTFTVQNHSVRLTFTCSYCQKELRTKKGLIFHQRRHTGQELRSCHLCSSKFTRTNHLRRHLKTHFKPSSKSNIKKEPKTKEETIEDGSRLKLSSNDMNNHMDSEIGFEDIKDEYLSEGRRNLKGEEDTEDRCKNKENEKEKQVMQCEFCDRKFKYRKSFVHHMQTEHEMSDESDAPYTIDITKIESLIGEADENSESAEAVDSNDIKTTELNSEYNDSTLDENNLFKPDAKGKHYCHVCNAKFLRANHLTRHMTIHRSLLIYKCEKCDKSYASPVHLATHVQEDHIDKPYICNICEKQFSRGEHLIRHLRIHDTSGTQEQHKCSICEKKFTRSDHLARHTKLHVQQDKRHVCSECGKAFNRLDNLKTHQRVHTGLKDTSRLHLCVYCGKEFNSSSNMIVHMRRHTGERPYKCSICSKGFPRSHDLKCHERTHSGEKPYLCTLCGKSFNKSNKLLRHTRVHTGERPYACSICGRAFTQSNDLALHMRRHTGARPYVCGVCPARFIQSGQLKSHRRSTGHWMDIPPDLKGGHRVEQVTPITNPAPIKFKTHGKTEIKLKHEEVSEEMDEQSGNIIQRVNVMGMESNLTAVPSSYVIDDSKLVQQSHGAGYLVFTSVVNSEEQSGFEPKICIKDAQIHSISSVNSDGTIPSDKVDIANGTAVTFSSENSAASYSATQQFNYENYG